MVMSHKEATTHFRNRLKAAKIKARVKMNEACGIKYITIVTPTYEARFTSDDLKEIGIIAQVLKLTSARGSEIDLDHIQLLTGKGQFDFEFHAKY